MNNSQEEAVLDIIIQTPAQMAKNLPAMQET